MYTDMQSCLASLVSKPIYAQSMAVDSLRVLAAVIALSVLGADSAAGEWRSPAGDSIFPECQIWAPRLAYCRAVLKSPKK
jgi:hypothetical protein